MRSISVKNPGLSMTLRVLAVGLAGSLACR